MLASIEQSLASICTSSLSLELGPGKADGAEIITEYLAKVSAQLMRTRTESTTAVCEAPMQETVSQSSREVASWDIQCNLDKTNVVSQPVLYIAVRNIIPLPL